MEAGKVWSALAGEGWAPIGHGAEVGGRFLGSGQGTKGVPKGGYLPQNFILLFFFFLPFFDCATRHMDLSSPTRD